MIPALLVVALAAAPLAAHTTTAHAAAATGAKQAPRPAAAWSPAVPFIENDFGRAMALARERQLPVFIEGWAPW